MTSRHFAEFDLTNPDVWAQFPERAGFFETRALRAA